MGQTRHCIATERGVGCDHAQPLVGLACGVAAVAQKGRCDHPDLRLIQIGRNLQEYRCLLAVALR
jgi:hypothetical protein